MPLKFDLLDETFECPVCGHKNHISAKTCEKCKTIFPERKPLGGNMELKVEIKENAERKNVRRLIRSLPDNYKKERKPKTRDEVIKEFQLIPGITKEIAERLYDVSGIHTLSDLIYSMLMNQEVKAPERTALVYEEYIVVKKRGENTITCPFCKTRVDVTLDRCPVCDASMDEEILRLKFDKVAEGLSKFVNEVMQEVEVEEKTEKATSGDAESIPQGGYRKGASAPSGDAAGIPQGVTVRGESPSGKDVEDRGVPSGTPHGVAVRGEAPREGTVGGKSPPTVGGEAPRKLELSLDELEEVEPVEKKEVEVPEVAEEKIKLDLEDIEEIEKEEAKKRKLDEVIGGLIEEEKPKKEEGVKEKISKEKYEEYRKRIDDWKAEGYDVTEVEKILEEKPEQFEELSKKIIIEQFKKRRAAYKKPVKK